MSTLIIPEGHILAPKPATSHVALPAGPIDYSPAYPDWEDLTEADIADHREWCLDGCGTCDEHRDWATCVACGRFREVVDGVTVCCGARDESDPTEDPHYWSDDAA